MVWKFLKKDIWHVDLATLPKWKAYLYRFLRILILTSQGFTKSQIQQGASSLTYYTLLAIVPVIALLIGIARGFRLQGVFEAWLIEQFADQKTVIIRLFEFAESSLQRVNQGLIAGIGVALFLWAALKILIYMELVMNRIWEVQRGRSIARCFSDYLALIFLCPIIIFISSGLSVYLTTALAAMKKDGLFIEPLIAPFFHLVPFVLTCLLMTFLYIFMPNTRVRLVPALWAGLFTSVIYQILQWVYIDFQIGVSNYNAIYGTFAALPLFLIWIHISWAIILTGAKIAFSIQNIDAYEFILENVNLSHKLRMVLSLRIAHLCIKKFSEAKPPPSSIEISNQLSIPLSLSGKLAFELAGAGVLSEVKREKDEEVGFQPARSLDHLTIKLVIDMMDARGEEIPLPTSTELDLILKSLEKFSTAIETSDGNLRLKDI